MSCIKRYSLKIFSIWWTFFIRHCVWVCVALL